MSCNVWHYPTTNHYSDSVDQFPTFGGCRAQLVLPPSLVRQYDGLRLLDYSLGLPDDRNHDQRRKRSNSACMSSQNDGYRLTPVSPSKHQASHSPSADFKPGINKQTPISSSLISRPLSNVRMNSILPIGKDIDKPRSEQHCQDSSQKCGVMVFFDGSSISKKASFPRRWMISRSCV